ncbi:hypothetical protein HDE_01990 [Halotydeus destructor]|nr:hypothetical protein HDE_01990 [Halotydeus destructor]
MVMVMDEVWAGKKAKKEKEEKQDGEEVNEDEKEEDEVKVSKKKKVKKVDEDKEDEDKEDEDKEDEDSGGDSGARADKSQEFVEVDEDTAATEMACRDSDELQDCSDNCAKTPECEDVNAEQRCEAVCRTECYFVAQNNVNTRKCMVNLVAALHEFRGAVLKGLMPITS